MKFKLNSIQRLSIEIFLLKTLLYITYAVIALYIIFSVIAIFWLISINNQNSLYPVERSHQTTINATNLK
jgi:hypothetical protein